MTHKTTYLNLEQVDGHIEDGVLIMHGLPRVRNGELPSGWEWSPDGDALRDSQEMTDRMRAANGLPPLLWSDPIRPLDTDEEPWSVGLEPKTYSTTPADVFIAAAIALFALGVVAVLAIRRALR